MQSLNLDLVLVLFLERHDDADGKRFLRLEESSVCVEALSKCDDPNEEDCEAISAI